MSAPIREAARAKLNLTLHITGKRADGYHLLESLVAFTDIHDRLEVCADDTLSMHVEGEFANVVGAPETNLVVRAARVLQEKTGVQSGASITLTKAIPVGAGLGGGSADAAAALRALNQLWNTQLTPVQLEELGAHLGADVAMCVRSRALMARGVGEELHELPVSLPACYAVLVHPRTLLLTADVYRAYAQRGEGFAAAACHDELFLDYVRMLRYLQSCGNDLEEVACALSTAVVMALKALKALSPSPDLVRMTGSGACCFALYSTKEQAEEASEQLRMTHPQWWVEATPIY